MGNKTSKHGNKTSRGGKTTSRNGNTASQNSNTTTRDGNTPSRDGNTTSRDGNTTSRDGNTPSRDGNTTSRDGNTTSRDGNTPSRDGNTPSRDGNTTSRDGNTPSRDGNTPSRDGNTTSRDGNTPSRDGNTPSRDGNTTSRDGNTTSTDGNTTSRGGNTSSRDTTPGDGNATSRDDNTTSGDDNTTSGDDNTTSSDGNKASREDNTASRDENTSSSDDNTASSDDNTAFRHYNITFRDDEQTRQFYRQLCQYEDHVLRMAYEYFQDDLLHIVENMSLPSLLHELSSRNIRDVKKYQSLEDDRRTLARTLLQDIFLRGKEAVIGLWVSLYALRHESPGLDAVLEELCQTGDTLVEQILLDEHGHQLSPQLKEFQDQHKNHLHEKTKKLIENKPPRCDQQEEHFPFSTRYVNLIIVSTDHFRERSENELIETGAKHEEYLKRKHNELQRIYPNKLFRWCHQSRLMPCMVMVCGVPGVGKTTLMQKVVYDWVKGDLYQRFSFVFFFKFRELNRLDKVSLDNMILHQYPYLWEQLENILQEPKKLLFIFDGLDESIHDMDFTSYNLCTNPKQPEPCGQIVVSLVRKSLLNGCSVLMTSRPTRLASIDCRDFQRIVEITGFLPEERQMYFENFFPDQELAEKAFNYVKQNDTLYTFCYLPSYCWIICTVLSKSFQPTSSDQAVSLLPKTVTQLFAIFVANILSNHSLHKSDAQKILQSIGWMAEHGVMNHSLIFDEQDLDCFHVDNKSKLLSSFLIESEEPVSYSFLHLTVQEFFSALVHYADYSPEKLQKSLRKAKSYPDGRGEIFLRFLCGLSDGSTRSILTGYLDKQATQTSIDVITWLINFILKKQRLEESNYNKQRLLSIFFYLYETRNKTLVLESLKPHRSLDLSDVPISALDCTVLAFILDICTNIEELDLNNCSLDNEGLERLAPVLHDLQNLSLYGNKLPDSSCIQLAFVIRNNQSLKILDLSHNPLYGPHFSDLMEALSSPACRIEELYLANNYLPDSSCVLLASVIKNNESLKILDLSNNYLSGRHFSDLMEALSSPACRIQKLYLSHNSLPDTSCIHLASVIRNNQSLKRLVLSYNRLSGPHFSDLVEALSSPDCRIEKIHMRGNEWSEEEKKALRELKSHKPNMKLIY